MMNEELYAKLNVLLGQIKKSLADIKKNGRKARELKQSVANSRSIVTEVLEQQLGGVSLEQQICISEIPDEDWLITAHHIIDYINDPFVPVNQYEKYFLDLTNYLLTTDIDTLVSNMKFSLNKIQQQDPDIYSILIDTFERSGDNDSLVPDKDDYSLFVHRAGSIKQHSYDYLWLYRKLEDFTSKRTLASILMNWIDLQTEDLKGVISQFVKYCEPDIFASCKDRSVVNVGAGVGVAIDNLSNVYGSEYRTIYAYEMSPETFRQLNDNIVTRELKNVNLRQKCAGAFKSKIFFENTETSDNNIHLKTKDEISYNVDIVRIDDDIKDDIDMMIVDTGGEELAVIAGSEKTIRKCRPCMAINADTGYESLWRTATRLSDLVHDYKFYIRHYGGVIVPKSFVLYCK